MNPVDKAREAVLRRVCQHIQMLAVQLQEQSSNSNSSNSSNNSASLFQEINELLQVVPVKHNWFQFAFPLISILGIIGNLLNILVLTRRRMLSHMDRLEKSATYGLIALALSDMLFCVVVLPNAFIYQELYMVEWHQIHILYYKLYGIGLVNLFMMISTWLIVTMSMNRYIVVVYPLHARSMMSTVKTTLTIVLVFVFSTLLTLPYFLANQVAFCYNLEINKRYELQSRFSDGASDWMLWYIRWIWPLIADFIPFVILAFCNIRLVWELKRATNTRRIRAKGQVVKVSSQKVTLTLVIIVLMLLFLVSPSEILRYINPYESWGRTGHLVVSITNVLQAMNFAFNFILYCVVNANFRQTFASMFSTCSSGARTEASAETQRMITRYHTEKSFVEETELKLIQGLDTDSQGTGEAMNRTGAPIPDVISPNLPAKTSVKLVDSHKKFVLLTRLNKAQAN